jgi:hypothetical protein
VDSELAGSIVGRRYDAASFCRAADNNGLADEARVIPFLD